MFIGFNASRFCLMVFLEITIFYPYLVKINIKFVENLISGEILIFYDIQFCRFAPQSC